MSNSFVRRSFKLCACLFCFWILERAIDVENIIARVIIQKFLSEQLKGARERHSSVVSYLKATVHIRQSLYESYPSQVNLKFTFYCKIKLLRDIFLRIFSCSSVFIIWRTSFKSHRIEFLLLITGYIFVWYNLNYSSPFVFFFFCLLLHNHKFLIDIMSDAYC